MTSPDLNYFKAPIDAYPPPKDQPILYCTCNHIEGVHWVNNEIDTTYDGPCRALHTKRWIKGLPCLCTRFKRRRSWLDRLLRRGSTS